MKQYMKPKMEIKMFKDAVTVSEGEVLTQNDGISPSNLSAQKVSADWEGAMAEIAYDYLRFH